MTRNLQLAGSGVCGGRGWTKDTFTHPASLPLFCPQHWGFSPWVFVHPYKWLLQLQASNTQMTKFKVVCKSGQGLDSPHISFFLFQEGECFSEAFLSFMPRLVLCEISTYHRQKRTNFQGLVYFPVLNTE